jgi:hypothetical protein
VPPCDEFEPVARLRTTTSLSANLAIGAGPMISLLAARTRKGRTSVRFYTMQLGAFIWSCERAFTDTASQPIASIASVDHVVENVGAQ